MRQLYVVDSSAWLEYFADTDRADLLEEVLRECGENQALQIASLIYATTLHRNAEL